MRSLFIPMALAATLFGTPAQAQVQDYPSKTITVTLVLAAGTGLDVVARTWGEQLAAYVKARPGQLSYSSTRPGGAPRLATEMFMQHYGLTITHVPYKISPQAIVSKVISNLDLIPVTPASIESHQQYIAAEARKWGDLVRKLGLAGSQ